MSLAATHVSRTALFVSMVWVVGAAALVDAQTVQLRANENSERWGDRASATTRGKVLWVERDDATNKDDVYLFDGAAATLLQAQGSLTSVDTTVLALGSGATPGSVIAVWRRDTDFAWMSVDGAAPVLVSATNPADPAQPLNPEGVGIADGCVFLILQDLSGTFARKHVFRVDTATAAATLLTDPAAFPITGSAVGAPRVTTSGCQAAWRFFDGTGATPAHAKLHFYGGSGVSVVDQGEIGEPHLVGGRLVYTKVVAGVSQVFLYDGTVDGAAPVPLTTDTDASRRNSHAKTDGRHVAWLRQAADDTERHIVLNGGLQLTTAGTKPADGAVSIDFPIQLQRGQMFWTDAGGSLRYLTRNGTSTVAITPALAGVNPWLADGYVAFTGASSDGGTDAEPFRYTGTAPSDAAQPAPPLVVRATPGNGQVTVAWDRVLGASAYNLYHAREPGVTKDNYLSLLGGTRVAGVTAPFTVTGLTNGATYYFVVTVVEAGVEGGTSGEASAAARAPWCVKPGGGGGCQATLGAVLASAVPGDTVRVAAGTYTEYVVIDKTVTVEGGWNATFTGRDPVLHPTTLRPPDAGFSVVTIDGESADPAAVAPVLDGFTITGGGGGNHGGGLRVWHSDATVRNNVIWSNVGFLLGGGVWVVGGAPRFENNRIEDNTCDGQGQPAYGGGLHLSGTRATLAGNVIAYNRFIGAAPAHGGGVAVLGGGGVTLTGNSILANTTGASNGSPQGGGLYLDSVTATLSGNVVQANASRSGEPGTAVGGGLFMRGVTATLSGNTIQGNVAGAGAGTGQGGGLYVAAGSVLTLTDNLVLGNAAETLLDLTIASGGGLFVDGGAVTFVDNVIAENTVSCPSEVGWGGGVLLGGSAATFSGNTIRGNVANRAHIGVGGGIFVTGGTLAMHGDHVLDNQASAGCGGSGGGISAYATLTLDRLRVQGNCAGTSGAGGLRIAGGWLTLTNSLVTGNTAEVGGLDLWTNAQATLVGNTFVANAGTAVRAEATVTFVNNAVAYSVTGASFATTPSAFDHNLFWNNVVHANVPLAANLVADPLLDAGYAPRRGSPAIDAGRNGAVPSAIARDLAGAGRFLDDVLAPDTGAGTPPLVDIGAFEFAAGQDLIFADGFEPDGEQTLTRP